MLKGQKRYKSDFMISFLFLVFGLVFITIFTNPLPSIILFGYFFLHYFISALNRLLQYKGLSGLNK